MSDYKPTEEQPISVMVATPMYGGMCSGLYLFGALSLLKLADRENIALDFGVISNESLVTRARNELVRMFLSNQMEYLMFIDADIAFTGEDVLRLLKSDKDVVCGVYPKKVINWGQINKAARNGRGDLESYSGMYALNFINEVAEIHPDSNGCIEIKQGATGFMLIKRRVFEVLQDHVPVYRTATPTTQGITCNAPLTREFFATSIDSNGILLSEDYHFCDLWRNHGGVVHANLNINLKHVGTNVFGGNLGVFYGNSDSLRELNK
jgi:hypothetical protein